MEGERNSLAYLGSANFTHKGWGFLPNPSTANIEAGLVLLRSGDSRKDLLRMIPNTIGSPVELKGKPGKLSEAPVEIETEVSWPLFMDDVRLAANRENNRELELVVRIKKERVEGSWEILLPGVSNENACVILSHPTNGQPLDYYHAALSRDQLNILLTNQQVIVRWWACQEGKAFPLNVSLDARDELPVAPGSQHPGERLLLAYYQGRITYEELFPPEDLPEEKKMFLG